LIPKHENFASILIVPLAIFLFVNYEFGQKIRKLNTIDIFELPKIK
jgi:hypothetical protein